jgi:acylglycerol lipase
LDRDDERKYLMEDVESGGSLISPHSSYIQPVPPLLVKVLLFILGYFPNFPYYAAVNPKECSHDEDVQKWTSADPMVDSHVYLKCIPGPLIGGPKLLAEDYKNWPRELPLLVLHGDADQVTSCPASKELVEKTDTKDKEHKIWPGQFHEVMHEKGDVKMDFINYIIK